MSYKITKPTISLKRKKGKGKLVLVCLLLNNCSDCVVKTQTWLLLIKMSSNSNQHSAIKHDSKTLNSRMKHINVNPLIIVKLV